MSEKDHTVDDKDSEAGVDPDVTDVRAEAADTEAADLDDEAADGDESNDTAPSTAVDGDDTARKGFRRSVGALVSAVVLTVALLASGGLAGWLYVNEYRTDQETDPAATQIALDAAKTGTIALLSYSPESLDQDFANAKSKLTGDFLNYYTQFTEQIVTPAAREKSVKTAASVVRAAVSEMEPESAEVLVFINQTTTSKENPDGAFAASSVKVGLTKIDGTWLIESFDPV